MSIETGGNFRKVEEAEGLAEGSGVEQEVTEESHPEVVAQEQQVEQEAIPEPSFQLLQIGPDFDYNWASYDTQDRAILRLKEGDIEELKIELQKALESGQITFSNEGFKRLDIPEEQKEIKRKLKTIESTIQALIQSNDNLPRDLRETLQQEIDSGNVNRKLDEILERRINFISNRKRFKLLGLGIGKKEIQALESLRESIKAEFIKYSQLQNSEQDIVDRDVIIKFQQLPKSIQQSIYSLENPTSESINEVIDQAIKFSQSYQTPQELIEKRQEIRDDVVRELKYLLQALALDPYKSIKILQEKLGISEEILQEAMQDEEVQESAVKKIISWLEVGHIDRAKKIRDEFGVSEERVQEAAVIGIYIWYDNIDIAKKIRDEFGVSEERVQEAAKEGVIINLNRGFFDNAIKIIDECNLSVNLLKLDEKIQEAAKEGVIINLNRGFFDNAIKIIDKFNLSKLDEKIQEEAVQAILSCLGYGQIDKAKKIRDDFNISKEFMQQPLKEAFIQNLKYNKITKALDLFNEFNLNLTYFEVKAIEIFGIYLSYNIFFEIRDLENGVIGPELEKIGVTKAGKEGIQELAIILQELKSEFRKHNPENIKFENSEFITNYFMAYTGYKDSGWGNTDRNSFLQSVKNIRNIRYRPLHPEFEVIGTYQILKKKKSSNMDRSIYREDFLNRFSVLMEDIQLAKDNLENKKPLTNLVDKLKVEIENIIQNLKIKSQELQDNPQAQSGLGKRIELLEKIKLRSIQDFQENFKILSSFSELDSILRQVVFTMGFAKNRRQLDKSLSEISVENPSVDDISWALNFVDHITNKETMAKYFTDKKATKKFEEKINPTVLTEQMDLLQNGQITSGTTNITFSTHRDLYTEISGQIADACWASKYKSILTEFPNFSSILMVKDKETQNERIIGSSLLIETKSEDGDDLLIIRGLNPTDTMINSLDVKSYFEAVVDYARKLAYSTGKQLAISIDDNCGGHTTNRPLLFNYISNLKDTFKKVRLKNPSEANFNGYNLQGEVYLL